MGIIQGFMLIDVDVAALNNAGKDTATTLENAVMTKKIKKGGRDYPYVSGQAWRFWWREALVQNYGWNMSPVTREKKIAFTEADPVKYPDDDIFGYMRAAKKEIIDPETKKKTTENATLTRISPLKNSALIAVAYNPVVQTWSSMTRQEGDAVPYGKDEYCAVMKGLFSLDINTAGRFSSVNKSGFRNMNDVMKKAALKNNCSLIQDETVKDTKGNPLELVELDAQSRQKRIRETIAALKFLAGGAKRTTNYADVSPKLVVLTQFKSGNHPFSHLAKEDFGKPVFSIDALQETIDDFGDQFTGKIYIGKRKGFMDDLEKGLQELDTNIVRFGPVNHIIDEFVETIKVE